MKSVRNGVIYRTAILALMAVSRPWPTIAVEATVVCEDVVSTYAPADNGAGPLWCYGSPLVVRQGETVTVSIIQTGKDVPQLCNTRWQIWQRIDDSWRVVAEQESYREREPCPIAGLSNGELFVSANPSTEPPGTQYGPCAPVVVQLARRADGVTQHEESPVWATGDYFTDHSYRGFAADREANELILLHINARSTAQFVSHRDALGAWHERGKIEFPIRTAYPQAALRNGAAHVLAIGDIQEPNAQWRAMKSEHLQREWDYVFRRLFYTHTPDIRESPFAEPVEIDTVEETAGHITNLDLYVDDEAAAHLLYLKRPHVHDFIRDEFFSNERFSQRLKYVTIRNGQVSARQTLCNTPENAGGFDPAYARFHVASNGAVFVVAAGTIRRPSGQGDFVNVIFPVDAPEEMTTIPLRRPFRTFFTNTPRGGSTPSDELDLFGVSDDPPKLRYAHVRLTVAP